jgi:fido (protein-threonine AMPylation protein)
MLSRRPEATPGEFKEQTNFAGTTQFVEPAFVRGTLLEGVRLASSVPEGLARAIFYAFLVSDVHPFNDGSGRLSRLMMNAELSRCDRCRIIIPTLYHEQYVDAQRALTRRDDPEPLIRALSHIARWGTLFDYRDLD